MALETLRAMANGGMHDQLGGGFHRYSVDERWFVPHFEKMLYDQAQLAIVCTSKPSRSRATRSMRGSRAARSITCLRDMTDPEGGFYSAEDADSVIDPAHPQEKGEGAFYMWTAAGTRGMRSAPIHALRQRYGVEDNGNVHDDPHGEFTGKNILYLRESLGRRHSPLRLAAGQGRRCSRSAPSASARIWTTRS